MSHFRVLGVLLCMVVSLIGMPVLASEGVVELKMLVEKEVEVKDEHGKSVIKRVAPKLVLPGDELIYIIRYTNNGEEEATDVVISNPIQKEMLYVGNSAYGKGSVIKFSVDDGVHFDIPEHLVVILADGKKRKAAESDYTHIQWLLKNTVLVNASGQVGYRAKLK